MEDGKEEEEPIQQSILLLPNLHYKDGEMWWVVPTDPLQTMYAAYMNAAYISGCLALTIITLIIHMYAPREAFHLILLPQNELH